MVINGLGPAKQSLYLTVQFLMLGLLKMRYETIISELKKCKACILKRRGWQKRGMVPIVELVLARPSGLPVVSGGCIWEARVVPDCRANAP